MIKIAIDAMGGDYAPGDIVQGAVTAAKKGGIGVYLVGQQEKIKAELAKIRYQRSISGSSPHRRIPVGGRAAGLRFKGKKEGFNRGGNQPGKRRPGAGSL